MATTPRLQEQYRKEILPELKRQGKALIVISHDDRFFGVADKRIHLREGRQVPIVG